MTVMGSFAGLVTDTNEDVHKDNRALGARAIKKSFPKTPVRLSARGSEAMRKSPRLLDPSTFDKLSLHLHLSRLVDAPPLQHPPSLSALLLLAVRDAVR